MHPKINKVKQKYKPSERIKKKNIMENQQTTSEDIRKLIVELNLPSIVLDLFNENCKDKIIRKYCSGYSYPYQILDLPKVQQNQYCIDRYKPLLVDYGDNIFAYDVVSKGFTLYDIELFIEKELQILKWDGIFVGEILNWWEYEATDDEILYLGNLFRLKYTKLILESVYSTTNGKGFSTLKEKEKWKQDIIRQYDLLVLSPLQSEKQ